jgi:hypothetical protein
VQTTGVIVAEAGRLGTPALLAIGAADAGLIVRLPADSPSFVRGTALEVTGRLAAPYGQLQIRPARGEVRALGADTVPTPLVIPSSGLTESMEARLATATGRLLSKPKRTAGGDLTLVIERDGGTPIKVMADASSRVAAGSLKVGAMYRIVGVVGQRATHAGAFDGYRLWIRDAADLAVVADATPSGAPTATPPGGPATTGTISIAGALRITDRTVAIDAIVTTPATLLDASGRRIVVQDGTAAVEVLIPSGSVAPPVGARVRVEGRIGVAYGAPRCRADRLEVAGSGPLPPVSVLHGSPREALEWRLASVTGRVTSIHKLGDRWRAELMVGTETVVIVGQPGAGIASGSLSEGRTATVTGIVRRPFPSATDRRFALTPRFPADIRVAGRSAGGSTVGGRGATDADGGRSGTAAPPTAIDADLVDLGSVVGRLVRVGGLVLELGHEGFTLDDGTATGRVVLRAAALDQLALVEPDDALNAIGRVEATADGPVVIVDDPGGITVAGDPVPAESTTDPGIASGATSPSVPSAGPGGRLAVLAGGPFVLDTGAAGLGTLLAISAASLAVTLLRREHARRRSATRIAARLVVHAGPRAPIAAPNTGERGPSTIHSA